MNALRWVGLWMVFGSVLACQSELGRGPVALPYETVVAPGEVTVDLWVFGADAGSPPFVSTTGTQVRRAD
jgi:hypothetical protein